MLQTSESAMRNFLKNSHRTQGPKIAKVGGSQMPMEARMQNEKNPRRSEKKEEPRRGTQQAGRSTRAIGNEGRSFSRLLSNTKKVIRRKRNAFCPRMGKNSEGVRLWDNPSSAAAIFRIHPPIDARNMLAGHGRHLLNAYFGNHRLGWL